MPYRLAVFDFDGTLVDTSVAIVRTARAALAEAGFPEPTAKQVRLQVGLPLDVVMDKDRVCTATFEAEQPTGSISGFRRGCTTTRS